MAIGAMKIIVIDTNTFIAAGWHTHAHARRVFAAVARRQFRMAVTDDILAEYQGVSRRPMMACKNYTGLLAWIEKQAVVVSPAPTGKQRSRDLNDDIFIACALTARAESIVTMDKDLLSLGKPFGIEMIHPARFIARHGC
jgi:putative PIN family toxin of toxin-antitoxin system